MIGIYYIHNHETYGISVKKSYNINYTSHEIGSICGDQVWDSLKDKNYTPKVNLNNPNKKIYIEIRKNNTYIFFNKIKCLGGLPIGSQGKMISLLSGGIDSPVAAWLMMKRGVEIIPLFIDNGKYGSEEILKKVRKNLNVLFSYYPKKKHLFYIISHEKLLDLIKENCKTKNICILCKRSMFIIANEIRKILNLDGIITGSSLGQVASQTSKNLRSELYNLSIPIYHPLFGFDKQEIIDLSKKIGTYNNSIINSIDCKIVPKKPEVCAEENTAEIEEQNIGKDIFIENINETIKILKKETYFFEDLINQTQQ